MKKIIILLLVGINIHLNAQIIHLIDETFDNELPSTWDHCSSNWGNFQIWKTNSGYLTESSGPYFGAVLNGLLLPPVDITEVDNPTLEFEYALGESLNLTQLSIYYTDSINCETVWDSIYEKSWLKDYNHIESYSKTNAISDAEWFPDMTDFQKVKVDLEPFISGSTTRIAIVADYNNVWADGTWVIDNLKLYGQSTSNTIDYGEDENFLHVFPNPAAKSINVSLRQFSNAANIKIYSSSGEFVKSQLMNDKQIEIDISDLAKGMYFLKSVLPEGVLTKKFMVYKL